MRRLSFALVLLFFCACSSTPTSPKPSAPEENFEIIDVHMHNHFSGKPERTSGITDSRESFLKELKEANIVGAVVHTGAGEDSADSSLNDYGVLFCAGVEGKVNATLLEKQLKSGRYGCIKIYLGYIYQYATDRNYEPVYRLAEKYDVPVVFHTGDTYDVDGLVKYSNPMEIDEVAVKHRKVQFVIAHCGNPWWQTAAEIAYKNSNVALECSAILIGDLDKYSPEALNRLMIEPMKFIFDYVEDPSRIMFGTDWPLIHVKDYLAAYKQAIPKEHWKAVFHDNARRIFKKMPVRKKTP
jgi:uncharacterized protein